MNKRLGGGVHELFGGVSEHGNDGRGYIGDNSLCIEKDCRIGIVLNEGSMVLFVMIGCFFRLRTGIGLVGWKRHISTIPSSPCKIILLWEYIILFWLLP